MKRIGLALLVAVALVILPGCGPGQDVPELGEVTGTVTLDGKPLANAQVRFEPESAALSIGLTDGNGQYELSYVNDAKGAAIGKHVVRIEWFPDPDEPAQEAVLVPARYNTESTLTAEVKAGKNENVNFELTSR